MKHLVVGTAGHVDHGKTSLIKALTGFDGDTLKEEKKRGITIDLSFSNLQNKDTNIAFIDVPGHEKLVKNMIAGAFGFDGALVVIDAKEGIKPQSIEHLQILNLLSVSKIIIAVSKKDLVDDIVLNRQIEDIENFIKRFKNLSLHKIVSVSIYDENSITLLKETIFDLPSIEKRSNGLFRYYVDRAFSVSGAGSIVTGTVLDGEVKKGDKVYIAQLNQELQVKNIQVHEKDVLTAFVSLRTALNLQTSKQKLFRGLLLTKKGYIRGFNSIDVWIESISDIDIVHNSVMQVFLGTMQKEVKVLLYKDSKMQSGFARLESKEKLFTVFNEPFILQKSGKVVAGGKVLNPIDDPIKKRNKVPLLELLHKKDFKKAFALLSKSHKRGFGLISSNQRFGISHDEALKIAKELKDVFVDEKALVVYDKEVLKELRGTIKSTYQKNFYALLSAKSLSLKIKWASETLLSSILENMQKDGDIVLQNGVYTLPKLDFKDIEILLEEKIFDILDQGGISPKAPYNIYDELDIDRKVGDRALKSLTSAKKVKRLQHNLFVTFNHLICLIENLKDIIRVAGYVDVQLFREYYPQLSRKYLIAYLDYLDSFGDIQRDGNRRILA